jgi:hypothetical protein
MIRIIDFQYTPSAYNGLLTHDWGRYGDADGSAKKEMTVREMRFPPPISFDDALRYPYFLLYQVSMSGQK